MYKKEVLQGYMCYFKVLEEEYLHKLPNYVGDKNRYFTLKK